MPQDQTPDYRERLAYGTDQGRWLAQQTAGSDKPSGGRARPRTQRAMHSFDEWNSESPTTVVDDDDERKKAQKPWRVNPLGLLALVLGAVVLVNSLDLLQDVDPSRAHGCTSIVAEGVSAPIHGRNLDWALPQPLRRFMLRVEYVGSRGRFTGVQLAGMVGVSFGLARGVCSIAMNDRFGNGTLLQDVAAQVALGALMPSHAIRRVLESAVIGVPHPDFGETVVGVLVAEPGESPDLEAIEAAAQQSLARFKHPRKLACDCRPRRRRSAAPK